MIISDAVDRLIQRHAIEKLRSYQGNLACVLHAVKNDWVPPDGSPEAQSHLELLRRHLAATGHSEVDDFLLRFGLTVPGFQRGIVPPLMGLDTNRGGFSTRRQEEAEGQILRLLEALAIGRRFIPTLGSGTEQAIMALADLSGSESTPEDDDWLRWIRELSIDEAAELGTRAIELFDDATLAGVAERILQRLAGFRREPLSTAVCQQLVARKIFWPSSLYRESGDAIADRLIALINESVETISLNHVLLALAWTRSTAANKAFQVWTESPPAWGSKLHVAPKDYLRSAGWTIDAGGRRRDLVSLNCHRLVPSDGSKHAVKCRNRIKKKCPTCSNRLRWLFDFSGIDSQYFQGEFADAPRKVLCCLNCACFEPSFSNYRGDDVQIYPGTEPRDSESFDAWEPCTREFGASFPPFACAEPFALNDASTLGGIPMWLQDEAFPHCIECGEVMIFLAQHDNGPFSEEGIYYAFFCAACHIAAVCYQQT